MDFLKMDQGGESIHRINKLATLKPSLVTVVNHFENVITTDSYVFSFGKYFTYVMIFNLHFVV